MFVVYGCYRCDVHSQLLDKCESPEIQESWSWLTCMMTSALQALPHVIRENQKWVSKNCTCLLLSFKRIDVKINILNTNKFLYKPKNSTLYIILYYIMYYINIIIYNNMYHMYFNSIFKMIQDFSDVFYTL